MKIPQISDESQLKLVLLHYKKFYLSLLIIVICIVLMVTFIIPQLEQYSQQRGQIQEVNERIAILERNIGYINAVNQEEQDKTLALVLTALPDDKDYSGILFGVRSASAKAGVGIGDFTFQVGELSAKSIITKNLPVLSLNLTIVGSPQDVQKFLIELSHTLPLSNVTEISLGSQNSELLAEFYYKPIPQLRMNYVQPILQTSGANNTMLEELGQWKSEQPVLDIITPLEGSSSAGQAFGF